MKTAFYDVERSGEEITMTSPAARKLLGKVDAVVFDCDGVLIDARESYDATILRTTAMMVEGFAGVKLQLEKIGGELILGVRRTGGFNDDWDTTYALILFSVVALGRSKTQDKLSVKETQGVLQKLKNLVEDFSSKDRLEGKISVDRYLKGKSLESDLTDELREYLNLPMDAIHNRMTRAFDEMYYGASPFQRIYGIEPSFWLREGLIERERVMITTENLDRLQKLLGNRKIAMATGRPYVAVKYTLGDVLDYFDLDASVFIGDDGIDPKLASVLRKYKKPSGASLVRAYEKLSSKTMLYVGDSAEDRMMVEDARKTYDRMLFAGIYGMSSDEAGQISFFSRNDSDVITHTVENIPTILERTRA